MNIWIHIKNIIFIISGAFILAFGIVYFNMENKLGEGGFTGITLILYFLWDINPAFSYIALNVPIFFIGWKILKTTSFIYTLIGTTFVSLFLNFFQMFNFPFNLNEDMTLVTLFAGVLSGLGLGIIFRFGGTTGGVDIIARIFQLKFNWSLGKTMFVFDFFVIFISIFTILNPVQGMYTIVVVYISAHVIDLIQEGTYAARGFIINSTKYKKIKHIIQHDLNRGVTLIEGIGGYTNKKTPLLYCVVGKREMTQLKQIIKQIDTNAFITIIQVSEVIGEGFSKIQQK